MEEKKNTKYTKQKEKKTNCDVNFKLLTILGVGTHKGWALWGVISWRGDNSLSYLACQGAGRQTITSLNFLGLSTSLFFPNDFNTGRPKVVKPPKWKPPFYTETKLLFLNNRTRSLHKMNIKQNSIYATKKHYNYWVSNTGGRTTSGLIP